MDNDFYRIGIPIAILFFLLCSAMALASEGEIIKLQGVLMSINLEKNIMIVNERLFVLNSNTMVHNEKGSQIKIEQLKPVKPKTWVYIEGMRDKFNRQITVQKIYLLPKYIVGKEKHLYPFIQ